VHVVTFQVGDALPAGHRGATGVVSPGPQYAPGAAVHTPRHAPAPGVAEYVPGGHGEHATDPGSLYHPGSHDPLQAAEARPVTTPRVPAGQGLHTVSPTRLYLPIGHSCPVVRVLPGLQ
jgi:hypothetical protein